MKEKLSDQVTGEQEDCIWKARLIIKELQKISDQYFNKLVEETGLSGNPINEYLYDYIFNSGAEEDFTSYLKDMNR